MAFPVKEPSKEYAPWRDGEVCDWTGVMENIVVAPIFMLWAPATLLKSSENWLRL